MSDWTVARAAEALLAAEDSRADREPLTAEWPGLDVPTAYAVQDETLRRRLGRGERTVGVKLGLTSRAKQQRMNVSAPLTAWLTDAMVLPAGAPVPQDRLIHPRAAPALVFVMPRWARCTAVSRSSTAGTVTSGSRWPTWWPTTRRRAAS